MQFWGTSCRTGVSSTVELATAYVRDSFGNKTKAVTTGPDPYLSRFFSADPAIQNPYDSQNLNRYSAKEIGDVSQIVQFWGTSCRCPKAGASQLRNERF